MQRNASIFGLGEVALERSFVIYQGNNYLTWLGGICLADKHQVAIVDSGFDHRVTVCSEDKEVALPEKGNRKADILLNVLIGELRDTTGD